MRGLDFLETINNFRFARGCLYGFRGFLTPVDPSLRFHRITYMKTSVSFLSSVCPTSCQMGPNMALFGNCLPAIDGNWAEES